jgi:hypothetical protein
LGIEVLYTPAGLVLSQAKYAKELLSKTGMTDCRPCGSPCVIKSDDPNLSLFDNPEFYRSIVGSLQYLTLTRPDLSFAVNAVCQHMHSPTVHHFNAVKRIIRYVQGTLHQGLQFLKGSFAINAYSDADWAGDSSETRLNLVILRIK